jgi:hypothetical protein
MNAVSIIMALILVVGLFCPPTFLLYLVFIFPAFGSVAIVPTEVTGGASLTPGALAALFFILKNLTTRGMVSEGVRALRNTKQLGYLGMFWIVALVGAIALPRIFAGSIHVFTMKSQNMAPVGPSMANFTQSAYLSLSIMMAAISAAAIRDPRFNQAIPKAILAGALAIIITGLMDIIVNAIGAAKLLDYFRTASYAYMTDNYMDGARRIIGLLPEASSFGGASAGCCALSLFLRPIFQTKKLRRKALWIGYGCGLMALLSTSSTAYVAMAVIIVLYVFYRAHGVSEDNKLVRKSIASKFIGLTSVAAIGVLVLLLASSTTSRFGHLIDTVILKKQSSSSYIERTSWTTAAYNGFLSSHGLGLGVGSVRTSNFFMNILASTGVIGAGLFAMFLFVIFTRKADKSDARANVYIYALKLALIPGFVAGALAGTTPDFGIVTGMLFGIIAGLGYTSKQVKWVSPLAGKNIKYAPSPVQRNS